MTSSCEICSRNDICPGGFKARQQARPYPCGFMQPIEKIKDATLL